MALVGWSLQQPKYKRRYDDVSGVTDHPKRWIKREGPYSKEKFRGKTVGVFLLYPSDYAREAQRFWSG